MLWGIKRSKILFDLKQIREIPIQKIYVFIYLFFHYGKDTDFLKFIFESNEEVKRMAYTKYL